MKKCGQCQIEKEEIEFNKNKSTKSGLQDYCRDCQKKSKQKWSKKYPGRVAELSKKQREKYPERAILACKKWRDANPDKMKNSHLQRKYGITISEWNRMFREQCGKCLICDKHRDDLNRDLAVDHCHDTGKVRGLLCVECNRGLGYLGDSPERLKRAAEYLVRHVPLS